MASQEPKYRDTPLWKAYDDIAQAIDLEQPGLLSPNPRTVSRELLTRTTFQPATVLNLLAAAWIQFMVKDWFSHREGNPGHVYELPLRSGADGKLIIGADGRLILPGDPKVSPDRVPGWWLGLEMMFTLFVLEHNVICDALRQANPGWTDEELYQRARLVLSALIAKIHTAEWTPAIMTHPDSAAGQFGVPYSLTEEFSIVYRMHPLIPDDYTFRSAADDVELERCTFRDIAGPHAHEVTGKFALRDLFYSFGIANPGALVLNNYPRFLQEFQRPDNGQPMDLAATDILRTRELGVPRYNEFRRLLRLKPAGSFRELADDWETAAKLSRVYVGDIERVDTIVGMLAEKKPPGFGLSDTAFRVFILMESRRLTSDRYFTADFDTKVYTRVGMDWVQNTTMADVLLRHYPELRVAMRGITSAFQPWTVVTSQ